MKATLVRFALLLAVVVSVGCARTSASTEVKEDGSWTRTVKLIIQKEDMMGQPSKFEDTFVLPTGAGWKTSRTVEKDNAVYTAIREAKLGETISKDIQIVEKGKVVAVNEVKVTQVAPGRFEYLETLTYLGSKKPLLDAPRKELLPVLNKHIPEASQASLEAMADEFFAAVWRMIFGPSEPMLPSLMFAPELAERKLKAKFGKIVDGILVQHAPSMGANQRLEAVRAMVKELDAEKVVSGEKDKKKEESGGGNDSLVSMFTSVKLPGRIVESNGELDEVAGEVYWSFFPESAQVGDVVLRAVCEVAPR